MNINCIWFSFLTIDLVCSIMVICSTQGEKIYLGIKSAAHDHTLAFFLTLRKSHFRSYINMSDKELDYAEDLGQSSGAT